MLKAFKRTIRSKARDDETDARRFDRMLGVLKEVSAETSREYEGLLKRMRELSSRDVNETVYAILPSSEAKRMASRKDVEVQLKDAVARTERLLEQMKSQKALVEVLRKTWSNGGS